ncbi:hypothetical protein [Fischerella sp. JS2]|nr:hypothetical protein [Fischerella sp. JS2]
MNLFFLKSVNGDRINEGVKNEHRLTPINTDENLSVSICVICV